MPDHSIDAEQDLLGAILVNSDALRVVSGIVTYEHFYEPIHQKIFDVCSTLFELGKVVSLVTVQPFMPMEMPVGEGVTLKQYLARLAAGATTIINSRDYAQIIRNYADMRGIQAVSQKMLDAQEPDPDKAAAETIEVLDDILAARTMNESSKGYSMGESVVRAIDAAALAYQQDGVVNGLKLGLRDLDWKLSGLQPGQLVVLAGRPGMSKTGLSLGMALNMAHAGDPGVIFSLEMDDVELTQRMLSDLAFWEGVKIPYNTLRNGRFDEKKFFILRRAAEKLEKLPIRIETKARLTLGELSARARRWKRRGALRWMVIDYLQLMEGSRHYAGQRVQQISEITMGLKALAKELAIPIILLSQLSRDVEKREDKRPFLSDTRDSGSIEQDADVVLLLYREEYYLQNKEPRPGTPEHELWQNEMQKAHGKIEINIGKQRAGPTGTVTLWCDISCNAFRSLSEEELPQRQEALAL